MFCFCLSAKQQNILLLPPVPSFLFSVHLLSLVLPLFDYDYYESNNNKIMQFFILSAPVWFCPLEEERERTKSQSE